MRLALSIATLVVNGLGILLLLLILAFGHMIRPGVIVALAFIAMSALNILAIVFGARLGERKPSDIQATVHTFD